MKVLVRTKNKWLNTGRLADGTLLDVFGKLYVITYSSGKQARYLRCGGKCSYLFLGNKYPAGTLG